MVARFGLGGRNVADGFEQTPGVEPVHPIPGGVLDRLQRLPRTVAPDDLGLVEAVGGLGQSVVVGIADASHGGLDAGVGETLGVFDSDILRPAVAMMNETTAFGWPAIVERLFQGVQDDALPSRGSTETVASPRTSKPPSKAPSLGSSSPALSCSLDGWRGSKRSHNDSESDSQASPSFRLLSESGFSLQACPSGV